MARMTDDERERRALQRARRAAEAAEADDRRLEERHQQWQRERTRLTWAEYEAGEPCRGCGLPMRDGLDSWFPLNSLTPDQRAEYDQAEELFRERHHDCRSYRWSGGRVQHCGYCCPPPPMSPQQWHEIERILSSHPARHEDQDAWDLTLTCGHTVRRTQHRDHDRYGARVVECPTCEQRRGVIAAQHIGPADDPAGKVARDRLTASLAAAQAKLDKQRRATAAAERKVAELTRELDDLRSSPPRLDL